MRLPAVLFGLLLVLYIWPIDHELGPNVKAHVDQAAAAALEGTLAIDRLVPNTIDWSQAPSGRYYPAKAPGAGLAAIPVFWALARAERAAGQDPLDADWFPRNAVLINWLLNAVVSAFAMTLLFRLALALSIAPRAALAGTLAIAVGTAYYPYATIYYAHAPAANAIIIAAFFVFRPSPRPIAYAAAGLFAGLAVMFDYPAVIAAAALAGAIALTRPHGVWAYVAGGCLPLAMLLWYHQAVFGSPWTTAYAFQNPVFVEPGGRFLRAPQLSVLAELTVLPYRGVFVFSPVLIVGMYGAWLALQERGGRRVFAATALSVLVLWLLVNASYLTWWGGFTAGPRFIIPAVVLFGPLVAIGLERVPRFGLALLAVSVLNYFAITAVSVILSDGFRNPLGQAIYPRLVAGNFLRSNIGLFLGLPGLLSLVPPITALAELGILWRSTPDH